MGAGLVAVGGEDPRALPGHQAVQVLGEPVGADECARELGRNLVRELVRTQQPDPQALAVCEELAVHGFEQFSGPRFDHLRVGHGLSRI